MNKDNYIRLLEKENQEYFEKAIKTMKDCCCHEIPELNGEINELLDNLNDLRADWAADHAECRKTKPQLDPDFINEDFAVTFNSELEYWSFMELCWGANLRWLKAGDPREGRPKDFVLMAHAVSCMGSHLKFALLNHYECELGYEIVKASEYLGVYQ